MIRGIIFDMDGTLVNSIPLHYQVWQDTWKSYGIDFDKQLFDEVNGMNTPKIAEHIVKKFSLHVDPREIAEKKRKAAEKLLKEKGVEPFHGVQSTLVLLKRLGYRIGLASSSTRPHIELSICARLDFEFDAIVAGDEVQEAKPSPEIFLKCAEGLGCDPLECIVVEDAQKGIMAANAAGMVSVGITNTTSADNLATADCIIDDIKRLNSDLIENLGGIQKWT